MYKFYASPTTLDEALALKAEHGENARVMAGGTDLLIEMERGVRRAPDGGELGIIDLTRIPGLAEIDVDYHKVKLGPLVTHNQCLADYGIRQLAFPLARACWEVGAPQIRNRATIVGNLVTASPANDTIVPLMVMNAWVMAESQERGRRSIPFTHLFKGFRQINLAPDEIITYVRCDPVVRSSNGNFIKLGLRRAQAISVISVAAVLERDYREDGEPVKRVAISLGAVAPTVVRASEAERYLYGQTLTDDVIAKAANLALDAASPIDDIRSSADYRLGMVKTLVARILRQLRDDEEREGWPFYPVYQHPVTLWGGNGDGKWPIKPPENTENIEDIEEIEQPELSALINGQPVTLSGRMTLLDSLRAAGLTGVKEGCAEGECGACTIFLDGMAVMACLVPAERAVGSQVVTVEGLADVNRLHPVQDAFIQSGGVQCGYCTPGFVMSAAKLLEEHPQPTRAQAEEALTGNLCRCTGYRKIIDAVVLAGELGNQTQEVSTNA